MRWFKFYGQDFLTDTKIMGMDPLLKLCYVTLLCLADEQGTVTDLEERILLRLSGTDDDQSNEPSDYDRTKGCLKHFESKGMISITENVITITNYHKRQNEFLSNAERQKRFRERHKNDSNEKPRYDRNARLDKNRLDKNRIDDFSERKINKKKDLSPDGDRYLEFKPF